MHAQTYQRYVVFQEADPIPDPKAGVLTPTRSQPNLLPPSRRPL